MCSPELKCRSITNEMYLFNKSHQHKTCGTRHPKNVWCTSAAIKTTWSLWFKCLSYNTDKMLNHALFLKTLYVCNIPWSRAVLIASFILFCCFRHTPVIRREPREHVLPASISTYTNFHNMYDSHVKISEHKNGNVPVRVGSYTIPVWGLMNCCNNGTFCKRINIHLVSIREEMSSPTSLFKYVILLH